MVEAGQPTSDDFAGIVAMATNGQQPQPQTQPQQTPIQQHFQQNSVTGVIPGSEGQVATEAVNAIPPIQQPPVQQPNTQANSYGVPQQQPNPEQTPQQQTPQQQPPTQESKPEFKLDEQIDNLLEEFGISTKKKVDNQPLSNDNNNISTDNQPNPNDKESIAKQEKINILLEKVVAENGEIKDQLGQERYEKEQYKMAAEKLQNKVSELLEQKTALEYDENRLQVNDEIKDFVHFYNKRTKEKDQQTPDSVLTKRTLAEAVKVVETITKLNLDSYINQYYLASNPQIPKIGNNHYFPDQMAFDPNKPRERSIEEKKADPKWNPMEDRF